MHRGRLSLTFALALGLACGSDDPPAQETDGSSGTGTTDAGDSMQPTTGTTDPASDGTTTHGSGSDTGPDPDTGSGGAESSDTSECPFGTDGCPCDEGDACTDGLVCGTDGQCQPAPVCRSIDAEPNDDEASALTLTELNCGDTLDLGTLGTLEGPGTDWYRFFGDEGIILCPEQPRVTITAEVDPDVCVFIECLEGTATQIDCGAGSSAADSPEGRPGCCGTGEARLDDYECGGLLTPRNIYVWVSVSTGEVVCTDYDFVYSF